MRIFLDTANVEEIRRGARLGVVAGVTTNPSLFLSASQGARGNGNPAAGSTAADVEVYYQRYRECILEIAGIIDGPISAECISRDVEGLLEEGRRLASWHPNVVVKIPIDEVGLEATSQLARQGVKVNSTLVFSTNQALLAAAAGAAYVSPFVGRLDDVGHDGMAVVAESVEILRRYRMPAEVIAASLRHPRHATLAAKAGADIATMPYAVLMGMLRHPLTDVGIERFLADAQRVMQG